MARSYIKKSAAPKSKTKKSAATESKTKKLAAAKSKTKKLAAAKSQTKKLDVAKSKTKKFAAAKPKTKKLAAAKSKTKKLAAAKSKTKTAGQATRGTSADAASAGPKVEAEPKIATTLWGDDVTQSQMDAADALERKLSYQELLHRSALVRQYLVSAIERINNEMTTARPAAKAATVSAILSKLLPELSSAKHHSKVLRGELKYMTYMYHELRDPNENEEEEEDSDASSEADESMENDKATP